MSIAKDARIHRFAAVVRFGLLMGMLITATEVIAAQGSEWNFAGGDRQNTRNQASEHTLSVANVNRLGVKWALTTAGDVSATPAVDGDTVYVPDWAGYLYAVDRSNGVVKWAKHLPAITGTPFDKARVTPAVTEDKIIVGTQGSILAPGGGP